MNTNRRRFHCLMGSAAAAGPAVAIDVHSGENER